ncbi:LysR family transcriptional regulator [Labrys miyagiensis]
MPDVDLNLLPALDALLAEGSVVGAARRLGMSTSAMSRTLARLRATTGDQLLVRAGRRLVPTPRASELRERVPAVSREALALLSPAEAELDLKALEHTFTIRANDSFVEAFAAGLIVAVATAAPGVRLRFSPKSDKDVARLRDGSIDLDIGVMGDTGPEVRVQALLRDGFIGAVRAAHPLLAGGKVTPELYAACEHVVASRRGHANGPVDEALAALGLARRVIAIVPSFSAVLAVARASNLVALVPESFAAFALAGAGAARTLATFPLPVRTPPITVCQMWHPRLDGDPAHRWLRGVVLDVCGPRSGKGSPETRANAPFRAIPTA